MNDTDDRVAQEILGLEQQLLDPQVRQSPKALANLIADEFKEFSKSGCIYGKADLLHSLPQQVKRDILTTEFMVQPLANQCYLVTYVSIESGVKALRASVWCYRSRRWQLRFHQGTVISAQGERQ